MVISMKYILPIFTTILSIIAAAFIFGTQYYLLGSEKSISTRLHLELKTLGLQALKSKDVPIGAVLLYDDKIIGTGFNTVVRDSNAGGHAEINAISDAVKIMGLNAFAELDRKKLKIVSTFEPCPMCKGAIQEYGIKNILFLKEKPFIQNLKTSFGGLFYELNKSKSAGGGMQDSLFRLHPNYEDAVILD
jgi:tRNA(Arg) A34 adenosine deaminase TadA